LKGGNTPKDLGISLTIDEWHKRQRFDEATRSGNDRERELQWGHLQEARRAGAIGHHRVIMKLRLLPSPLVAASCLLRDLDNPRWVTKLAGRTQAPLIAVDARCDLLFDTELCQRSGDGCPHVLGLIALEQDNTSPEGIRGMEELRERAGPLPPKE
jgi:hypothetical protein